MTYLDYLLFYLFRNLTSGPSDHVKSSPKSRTFEILINKDGYLQKKFFEDVQKEEYNRRKNFHKWIHQNR